MYDRARDATSRWVPWLATPRYLLSFPILTREQKPRRIPPPCIQKSENKWASIYQLSTIQQQSHTWIKLLWWIVSVEVKNHGYVHDEFIRNRIWISERSRKVWPSKGEVKNCESVHAGSSFFRPRGKFYNRFLITHTHTHTHTRARARTETTQRAFVYYYILRFPVPYDLYVIVIYCSCAL